jgi:LuxR family maltose regulon positive regulatory protein
MICPRLKHEDIRLRDGGGHRERMARTRDSTDYAYQRTSPPALGPSIVERNSIVERICETADARLTLVRAPAGFGKTVLLHQCRSLMQRKGIKVAWLTLDSSDNDAFHFVTGVLTAIGMPPSPAARKSRALQGVAPLLSGAYLQTALKRIAEYGKPFALIFDEFECLNEPGVLSLVSELGERLPSDARIIIATRIAPSLGLARLRALGLVQDILAEDLRFSLDDTRALVAKLGFASIDDSEIGVLHAKTEGWPVALRLATMALERTDHPRDFNALFSGQEDPLESYLTEVVFDRQPEAVQQFLLRTSILLHISEPLAKSLMPDVDCAAMLRHVSEYDVLLRPLGNDGKTFRYHNLFADFLRARLRRESAQDIPSLHLAASRWFAAQGRPVPAIDHAIEAGDYEVACELLASHATSLLADGRFRLLARWFKRLPAEVIRLDPYLMIAEIWAACYTVGPEQAEILLQASALENTDNRELQKFILPLRPLLLAMMDRIEDAHAAAKRILSTISEPSDFTEKVIFFVCAMMAFIAGYRDEARTMLEAGRQRNSGAMTALTVTHAETLEGQIDLHEGRLKQARACFRTALEASRKVVHTSSPGNTWAGVFYAYVLYESNELDEAHRLLQLYNPIIREIALADLLILGYLPLVRIATYRSLWERSFQLLKELEYFGLQRNIPRVWATAKLERSRLLLMQGHCDVAREEISHAGDDALWSRVGRLRLPANELNDRAIAELRLLAHLGEISAFQTAFAPELAAAESSSRRYRALKLKVLHAIALSRTGARNAAMSLLEETLRPLSRERFVQLFVEEGPQVGWLVQGLAKQLLVTGVSRADSALLAYLDELLAAFDLPPQSAAFTSTLSGFTDKELRVLNLLAGGLTDTEMAQEVGVSASTVRTHKRSIYSKLDVHNRMQAVLAARRAGFI